MLEDPYDVAVIGAGVFGAWTAYRLQRAGAKVVLLDGYGPANSHASSGGESRIIRMSYGPDELYTYSAMRSLGLWQDLFNDMHCPRIEHSFDSLFHRTGVLLLARDNDSYAQATAATLERSNVHFEKLDRNQLVNRYPQFELGPTTWGILEPESGVLMARQAVRALVAHTIELGTVYIHERVLAPQARGQLESVRTRNRTIRAEKFVFACGPWLPKMFPELLGEMIHVTRQEVFFLGVPAGSARFAPPNLPVWIDFNDLVYAIPNVDDRGFKIAIDAHGPVFDPDTGNRLVTTEGAIAIRNYLTTRVPALKDSPIMETRVCQYENTSNGDFLIDVHPDVPNLWLVGGGSGHGFKHGPAVGEYVAGRISGEVEVQPRFTLATKANSRRREVY